MDRRFINVSDVYHVTAICISGTVERVIGHADIKQPGSRQVLERVAGPDMSQELVQGGKDALVSPWGGIPRLRRDLVAHLACAHAFLLVGELSRTRSGWSIVLRDTESRDRRGA